MSFKKAAASIEKKSGVGKDEADAILASSTRNASKSARKANPNLNNVKGGKNNPFKSALNAGKK